MKISPREWFRQIWPAPQNQGVLHEYAALGTHKLLLTDIALRGRVYSDLHVPGDHDATMVNIGRREIALEIIELAGERPERLFDLVPRPPKKELSHA